MQHRSRRQPLHRSSKSCRGGSIGAPGDPRESSIGAPSCCTAASSSPTSAATSQWEPPARAPLEHRALHFSFESAGRRDPLEQQALQLRQTPAATQHREAAVRAPLQHRSRRAPRGRDTALCCTENAGELRWSTERCTAARQPTSEHCNAPPGAAGERSIAAPPPPSSTWS